MHKVLLSSTLAAALATSAYAAGNVTSPNQSTPQTASQQDAANAQNTGSDSWVRVTSAERLVGREIQSKDGKNAGKLDALVIDLENGSTIYALIASGGDLNIGSDRIVVPFQTLETPASNEDAPLRISQSLDRIRSGLHIEAQKFADLADQNRVPQVYGPYGIAMPYGYVVPPSPQRDRHPSRYVLVRPSGMATLGGANRPLAESVEGTEVRKSNGEVIGTVDQIMVDPSNGRIPYLLLSSGGFLGIGNDWVPVPPQAVSWAPDNNALILSDKNVKPTAIQALHKTDLPSRVHKSQLQALYERFNLKPYRERAADNQG